MTPQEFRSPMMDFSALMRWLADSDEVLVRGQLLHMAAIAGKYPDLTIVPAHDARAFASLPLLK